MKLILILYDEQRKKNIFIEIKHLISRFYHVTSH